MTCRSVELTVSSEVLEVGPQDLVEVTLPKLFFECDDLIQIDWPAVLPRARYLEAFRSVAEVEVIE